MKKSAMHKSKNQYHYAFDAASVLATCRSRIQDAGCDDALLDLDDVLSAIESHLHAYFLQLIEFERQKVHDFRCRCH
jgi:hypothetical protein